MKLCHIIASPDKGGMENHVIWLCSELARHHEVTVIAPPWMEKCFAEGVKVIALPALLGSRRNPFTLWKLRRLLRTLNPDIVHAHGGKAAAFVAFNLFFKRYRRVGTVHGMIRYPRLYRRFDHVIAVSAAAAVPVDACPHTVILNGVPSLGLRQKRPNNAPPVVLAIGRLDPVKGFDLLIQAWRDVPGERLLIAGEGPHRAELERLIDTGNMRDRVTLLGHRTDIYHLISAADALVISSRSEGLPLVLIEALQLRCPVVATAVGGLATTLPEAMLVPPGDVAALAQKITATLADLPAYSRHCETMFRMAETELTLATMTAKTMLVYERLVQQSPRRTVVSAESPASPMSPASPPSTALVLGSGGGRGWAHFGVIKALREMGFAPDMVVGTSIGAMIGALYAMGRIDEAEKVAASLTSWKQIARLFIEMKIPSMGLIDGRNIMALLATVLPDIPIEEAPLPYVAVATDLRTHEEVSLSTGSLHHAVRSSISIPGVFSPVRHGDRWLVDGGLVNPLPVSVARACGATRVIAVDINLATDADHPVFATADDPTTLEILTQSFRIGENSITRERLLREPPDILIQPAVGHIGTLEFHRAASCIDAGYRATLLLRERIVMNT